MFMKHGVSVAILTGDKRLGCYDAASRHRKPIIVETPSQGMDEQRCYAVSGCYLRRWRPCVLRCFLSSARCGPTCSLVSPATQPTSLLTQEAPTSSSRPSRSNSLAGRRANARCLRWSTSTPAKVDPSAATLLDDQVLRHFFPGLGDEETRRANSLGSGVIVSSGGYVLTNNHVIEEAPTTSRSFYR